MKSIFTFCLCLISWTTMMAQTTVTFTPSKDNTLFEISNTVSNGAGSSIFAGNDNVGRKHRCLMRFDLSSIPANATINNATLRLTVNKTIDGTARTHELHKVSADWGEGTSSGLGGGAAATTDDATWSDRFLGVSTWNSLGGDFSATVSSSTSIGGNGAYSFPSTAQLIADVQGWVNAASTNFGWVVIGDENTSPTARGFNSRESGIAANRPTLSVTYTAIVPVELIDFSVNTDPKDSFGKGGKNKLIWKTASEINSKAFDIERSFDGKSFTSIDQVKANNKASSYEYVDNSPFYTTYYRLKQIDFDGSETYSKIVSILNKGDKGLKVYPTLVSNGILIVDTGGNTLNREVAYYAIYNAFGQQVQNGKAVQYLDVSSLTKGVYILRVGTEQVKFVKE